MKWLDNLANHIKQAKEKDLKKYLLMILAGIFIAITIITYAIYEKNVELVAKMKQIDKLLVKTNRILSDNDKIEKRESNIEKLIASNKDFDIREYFEKFCKDQKITIALEDWRRTINPVEGSDKFDEVVLEAKLKKQTTENLVTIIQALRKEQMIYIKALNIENTKNKTIEADITIATKRLKKI